MKSNHTLLFLLAFLAAQMAGAATLTVTSIADSGAGTPRDALASAANGDTINFSVTGTIVLTSGELLVTNNLTILGPGPSNLAVDGNAASRVFFAAASNVVIIAGLTITNGYSFSGGGIYNDPYRTHHWAGRHADGRSHAHPHGAELSIARLVGNQRLVSLRRHGP